MWTFGPRPCRSLTLAAVGILIGFSAIVGAQTAGATLTGRVVDASGGAVPGATVTITAPETGFTRSTVTESDGSYSLLGLPVGMYEFRVELAGFKTVEQTNLELNIASTRVLDLTLEVAGVETEVSVTAATPLISTSEVSVGTVVSQRELENLPLNGRQFANLGVLAPGTSLAYNSDPTKPGQLTVALNGGIGRNVNYIVDGGDNTDDTIGGALQNFSVENVQEFKIQTQNYKAEYGRSSGGVLTVVTKTGTNELHGSAFTFGRDDALNAITETEEQSTGEKSPYSRWQFGGSAGGPIVRDQAHFFGSYEATDQDTEYTVDSGGLLPEDGTTVAQPFNDYLAGAKVTSNLSPTQFLQVRFGYQKNTQKYGASPLASPDSLGTIDNKYYSLLAGHTAQLPRSTLNEFIFQYSNFKNTISSDSTNLSIAYPSGAHSGQNINTPQSTDQVKWQFKDDFSFGMTLAGTRHDFKTGVLFIHEPTLGGDFSVGVDAPQFLLLNDRIGAAVADITQYGGQSTNSTPVNQYSLYFQDDWRPHPNVTLNLGLRYDYWTGFDLDQRSNPIWQTLSTQTRFNEDYLRDFQGGQGGVLENDKNNVGPRFGISWDVRGDTRTVVRGGWGIFYDFPYTNATILFPASAVQSDYGVAYNVINSNGIRNPNGTFFQPGDPLPPNQLSGVDVPPPNEVASPTLRTPFGRQASFGFSHEITDGLAVGVDVSTVDYRDIPFRFRANPTTGQGQPRRFPDFANFRLWYGKGVADYEGANFSVRARMSARFTLQGFYTLSRIRGNVTAGADEFRLTDLNFQPDLRIGRDVSVNPLDPLCDACIGPLNTDARHRLTLGGTYSFPYDFTVAATLRARSALPYLDYTGLDLNGDSFFVDLEPGTELNAGRGDGFAQFDVRIAKIFRLGESMSVEALLETFNLFNAKNPAGFIGNRTASNFGEPTTFAGDPLQGEQRLAQFGARFRF
jgi:hypothetical protein